MDQEKEKKKRTEESPDSSLTVHITTPSTVKESLLPWEVLRGGNHSFHFRKSKP